MDFKMSAISTSRQSLCLWNNQIFLEVENLNLSESMRMNDVPDKGRIRNSKLEYPYSCYVEGHQTTGKQELVMTEASL